LRETIKLDSQTGPFEPGNLNRCTTPYS